MASILNILGLTIAFAVFMAIMTQVFWEIRYNRVLEKGADTYLASVEYYGDYSTNLSRPIGEIMGSSSPLIEEYTPFWPGSRLYKINGVDTDMEVNFVGDNFANMFSMEAVEGDLSRIGEPNTIIIPKSIADKYFKGESALGKSFTLADGVTIDEIVGVYEDFPNNTSFKSVVYKDLGERQIEDQSEWSYHYFYKFRDGVEPNEVIKSIVAELSKDMPQDSEGITEDFIKFTSLDGLYFGDLKVYIFETGNKLLSILLFSVAIIIILIAVINYINFFMALVPIRIRSLNISKVFGAPISALRWNVIFEAIGIVVLSFLLSLPLLQYISTLEISEFTSVSLSLANNIPMVIFTFVLALIVALIAGVFPSFYITKFSPALILKGSFGRSRSGRNFRAVLSAFQFVISMTLIILALFIVIQNKFLKDYDYGFERERIMTVRVPGDVMRNKDVFYNELKKNPNIENIAYSDNTMFNFGMGWGRNINGESVNFSTLPVSWNYPELVGLELVDGRFFIEEDATKPGGTAIFNETAAKQYNLKIGDKFYGHSDEQAEVVGIVKDFNFRSLHNEIDPICIYEFGSNGWRDPNMLNVKFIAGANIKDLRDYVKNSILKFAPNTNVEDIYINLLDENVESMYKREDKLSTVIAVFSIVSIIISLLGLFGIVVFETQYRRKEVAIRKIHGSTINEVLMLFNRQSTKVLAVSALISIPISWYVANTWLMSFAYRIPLHWWVFVCAVALVAVIVIALVTAQTFRAANENPVESLRSE